MAIIAELLTAAVTIRVFDVLQQGAATGRTFSRDEGQIGRDDVVVLSDGLWRRRFQSDRTIVGRRITLDGRPFTVMASCPKASRFLKIAFSVTEPRFRTVLFSAFAATALLLVATGIFGMLMYSVTRRTREIGLRIAVGAAPGTVARLVMREMLTFTGMGMAAGLLGALAAAALIRNLLFGIEPTDPTTFALASIFLLVVALIASYVPARRAARIDPAVTLKEA